MLYKLNIDQAKTKPLSKRFHVGGIPTVIVFDAKGKEVDRIIGYDDDRSAWLKTLLAYLYGIDTVGDLQSRYTAKPDLATAHLLAQKFLDRGDGASSLAWVEKARTFKGDEETDTDLTLIQGQAWLLTDPPKGTQSLMLLATTQDSRAGLDAFHALSAFYKRQARNATSPEEKQKAKDARLDVFHKVLAAHPSNPDVLSEYAWYCAGDGIELDKALAAAQKAADLKKDDAETLSVLAEVSFKAGKKDDALKAIDRAIQLDGEESFYKEQKEKFSAKDETTPKK